MTQSPNALQQSARALPAGNTRGVQWKNSLYLHLCSGGFGVLTESVLKCSVNEKSLISSDARCHGAWSYGDWAHKGLYLFYKHRITELNPAGTLQGSLGPSGRSTDGQIKTSVFWVSGLVPDSSREGWWWNTQKHLEINIVNGCLGFKGAGRETWRHLAARLRWWNRPTPSPVSRTGSRRNESILQKKNTTVVLLVPP